MRVLQLMDSRLNRQFRLVKEPDLCIGKAWMAHQFNVNFSPFPQGQLDRDEFEQRYLRPVASTLARFVEDERVTAFGVMPVVMAGADSCVVSDPMSGLSLRIIRQYNIMSDQMLSRFDLLAA